MTNTTLSNATLANTSLANTTLADHVMVFDDVLGPAQCGELIERFEATGGHEVCERDGGHSFVQLDVTQHWPDQNALLLPLFLSHFGKYQAAVNAFFWPPKFCFEHVRMKRYLPNGRDAFPLHVDVMSQDAARRFMTAFIYLNAPDAGETVFPQLDITVAPEAGKMLAFPPIWLFPHIGQPPQRSAKYILHTYLCYPPAGRA